MNPNEYQTQAMKTKQANAAGLLYDAVALAGEAGEVCNEVKKWHRDDNETLTAARRGQLLNELGDVLWYVANIAFDLGYTLEEVAKANIEKLKARYQRNQLAATWPGNVAQAIECAGHSPCREHDRIGDK